MCKRHFLKPTPTHWLFFVVLMLGVLAIPAHASNILDDVGRTYHDASSRWESSLFSIAKGLFLKLAFIEILWFAIWWTIERDDPHHFLVSLLKKMMALLFFWAILINFDTWIPSIIEGFSEAGSRAGGTGALTPSTVLDRGLEVSTKIVSTANNIGLLDGVSGLGKYLLAGLAALGILLAFGVIAGQMLVTLIESYIVVNAGVLFLGFAGSRWTTTFAEKFLSYAVSVGVKLFTTYLIIGAGQDISDQWASKVTDDMVVADYLTILVGSLVYMFLAWQIPAMASSMLTGSVSMTLGSAVATVGTMAAGAAGAAGAAAAVAGGTVNGVAGAIQAGTSAINQAKEKGATSFAGIAGGAIGAMGSAVGEAARDGIKGLGTESAGGSLASRIDGKTASIQEAKAAGSVSAASVPGGQPSAPGQGSAEAGQAAGGDAGEATRATPPAPEGAAAGGAPAAAPAAAAEAQPAAPAAADGGAAAGGAPAAAPAAAADGGAAAGGAPAAAPAAAADGGAAAGSAPAAAPAAVPEAQPAAPAQAPAADAQVPPAPAGEEKKGMFQSLAEHAQAMGTAPNDSASGAGVQINLKHD